MAWRQARPTALLHAGDARGPSWSLERVGHRGVGFATREGGANGVVVGDGAQIAATSGVMDDVPANQRWGGYIARPMKQWFREVKTLERLARESPAHLKGEGKG